MFICRLFHSDQPFEEVDARVLTEGEITLGRDPSADWRLPDDKGYLSRHHCALRVSEGHLFVVDRSRNGTYLDGQRTPQGEALAISAGAMLRLGDLSLLIDEVDEPAPDDLSRTRISDPKTPVAMPADWTDAHGQQPVARSASLLDAFCDGARLDVSALSSEDPAEVMQRVGAIYQQTVIALATLMAERARLKAEHDLDRTTIGAADNNPFKWAPTRQLALDLLCRRGPDFLSDAAAVRASFEDLSRHIAGISQGADAVSHLIVETLEPRAIEAEVKAQGFSLRNRGEQCWETYKARYATLVSKAEQPDVAKQAFSAGYRRTLGAAGP